MTSLAIAASNLTPADGLLAQIRLADHGIRSRVESLDLVTWLWHLSIAFHGVRVVVAQDQLQAAAEVLAQQVEPAGSGGAARQCAHCHEALPGDWDICWRCGTDIVGRRDETFLQETVRANPFFSMAGNVEFLGAWLLLVCTLIIFVPAFAFACLLMFIAAAIRDPCLTHTFAAQLEATAAELPDEAPSSDGDQEAWRALASAMFGFEWFSPLTFYSVWILCKSRAKALSTTGRIWRRSAWLLNVCNVAVLFLLATLIADSVEHWAPSWQASQFVRDFFGVSTGLSTSSR